MKSLADLLYPKSCTGCGTQDCGLLDYLCWDCFAAAQAVQPPFCSICGDPVPGDVTHSYICHFCTAETPSFDRARSAFRYDGAIGKMVRTLKYHGGLWLASDLARLLLECAEAEFELDAVDIVCPVPLHPSRRRLRGFNQAAELARELARLRGLRYAGNVLRRTLPTVTQTHLTAPERAANMRLAFEVGKRVSLAGCSVMLIDDVMTTGATVNACAKVLKAAGARVVYAVTVARG